MEQQSRKNKERRSAADALQLDFSSNPLVLHSARSINKTAVNYSVLHRFQSIKQSEICENLKENIKNNDSKPVNEVPCKEIQTRRVRIQMISEIVRCAALVQTVLMTSLYLIFENQQWIQMWSIYWSYCIVGAQLTDMLMIFIYGVQNQGIRLSQKKDILLYLLRSKGLSVILPLLFLIIFVATGHSNRWLLPPTFLGIWEVTNIIKGIGERVLHSVRFFYIVKLLKLFFMIMFFAHTFACLWIYLPQKFNKSRTGWLNHYDLINDIWQVQYINALYYVVVSMVTVGYGDIVPQTANEKVFCSMIVIVSCGIYGYSLNSIGVIFNELNKNSIVIMEKKIHLNRFMQRKNVSESLQSQVRQYLDYFWKQQLDESSLEEGLKVIQLLNSNLKNQLIFESNNLVIRDSPILANNFSSDLLKRLTQIITEQKFIPEEIIYEKEINDTCALYFIEQGDVQVITKSKRKITILQELQKGSNFGFFSFFTGQPRSVTMRSKNFSVLLKVDLQPFLEILREFEDDYEKYYFIRDQLLYSQKLEQLHNTCPGCGEQSHMFENCPQLHYQCDRIELVKNNHSASVQVREHYIRSQIKKKGALFSLEQYVDFAVKEDDILNEYEKEHLVEFYRFVDQQTLSPKNNEDLPSYNHFKHEEFLPQISGIGNDTVLRQFSRRNSVILEEDEEGKDPEVTRNISLPPVPIPSKGLSKEQQQPQLSSQDAKSPKIFSACISFNSQAYSTPKQKPNYEDFSTSNNHERHRYFQSAQKFSNEDNRLVENDKVLKLCHTLRSYDDKCLQIEQQSIRNKQKKPSAIFNQKSMRSFRRIVSQEQSAHSFRQSIQESDIGAQVGGMQLSTLYNGKGTLGTVMQRKQDNDNLTIGYNGEQLDLKKNQQNRLLQNLEYDTMKTMKFYFVLSNYQTVIQRFNVMNRYLSIFGQHRDKEKSEMLASKKKITTNFQSSSIQNEDEGIENQKDEEVEDFQNIWKNASLFADAIGQIFEKKDTQAEGGNINGSVYAPKQSPSSSPVNVFRKNTISIIQKQRHKNSIIGQLQVATKLAMENRQKERNGGSSVPNQITKIDQQIPLVQEKEEEIGQQEEKSMTNNNNNNFIIQGFSQLIQGSQSNDSSTTNKNGSILEKEQQTNFQSCEILSESKQSNNLSEFNFNNNSALFCSSNRDEPRIFPQHKINKALNYYSQLEFASEYKQNASFGVLPQYQLSLFDEGNLTETNPKDLIEDTEKTERKQEKRSFTEQDKQ